MTNSYPHWDYFLQMRFTIFNGVMYSLYKIGASQYKLYQLKDTYTYDSVLVEYMSQEEAEYVIGHLEEYLMENLL